VWGVILAFLAVGIGIQQIMPYDRIGPSVVAEPIMAFGGYVVSNAMLVSWIVVLLLAIAAFAATRHMQLVPSGIQNLLEIAIEAVMNLVKQTTGGDEKKTRWFFPFVMTFLLYIVVANLLGLLPGFGPIGIVHFEDERQAAPKGVIVLSGDLGGIFHITPEQHVPAREETHAAAGDAHAAEAAKAEFFPFFRAPSADFNMTLAFALISWLMTQAYGIANLGPLKFASKYIVLDKIRHGKVGMGLLDFVVGILEAISEVSKIISLSFRLFGNIFAGEVLLLVMFVLFPFLPLPFYFLELMVGAIQAFVFAILTLVFMTQATTAPHGAEEHHH